MSEPEPTSPTTADNATSRPRRVAIIGAGLAGLAAAVGLAEQTNAGGGQAAGVEVELFEARRRLGGRAASFADAASGESVDYCQHISMGCCTNLADFCRRTGTSDLFRADRVLNLFTRDGRCSRLGGSIFLPAPLHLRPRYCGCTFYRCAERIGIGSAMLQLARAEPDQLAGSTVAQWLTAHGQSAQAIERFWGAVLVSALGESVDRSSILHAQKVFVDAYLSNSSGYELHVPRVSLSELYDVRLTDWLVRQDVKLRLETAVDRIERADNRFVLLTGAGPQEVDAVIVAVTWQRVKSMLSSTLAALPELAGIERIDASRPSPACICGSIGRSRLSNMRRWSICSVSGCFAGRISTNPAARARGKCGRVLLSSRNRRFAPYCGARPRRRGGRDLRRATRCFPRGPHAKLLRWKMVADPFAVFSVRPGIEELSPGQTTTVPGFYLAGDWTKTGWPSTMEGAVRSGYLAAEATLAHFGRPRQLVAPNLPRGIFVRY